MEFLILGPLQVIDEGRPVPVPPGRPAQLLALLLLHADRVLPAERIIDELWADQPPASGAKALAFHVLKLRDALEPDRRRGGTDGILVTDPSGYMLRVGPDQIDAARFERLAAEGRGRLRDDPAGARETLDAALRLWRGDPLAEFTYASFAQPEIRRLEELRLRVLEDRIEADIALARHDAVIDELEGLVAEHPFRERLRGQLMTALYRAGRQAEALRAFQDGRQRLAEELGIDPGPELKRLEVAILQQDPSLDLATAGRPARPRNPYKGLRPFGERDQADFFGREALTQRLLVGLERVARGGGLLTVVGPSGSGKSSVVRAGLIPALRAGALRGSDAWTIAVLYPGADPFRELAAALGPAPAGPRPGPDPIERLEMDGDIPAAVAATLPALGSRLVLVIDQLEELFLLPGREGVGDRFLHGLVDALSAAKGRLLVVVTLRADYFDRPLRSSALGELIRAGTEVVTPLTREELERAIAGPAEVVGAELEPGLAAEVISDVADRPGTLPLLEYALTELSDRSDGRRLTHAGYAAIGRVLGALGRRAEETYQALPPDAREIARQVFLRLVALGEGAAGTVRRVPRAELDSLSAEPRTIDAVIDAFGRWRLLSFDRDPVTGEGTVEVAHEALLSHWSRLAVWVEEARQDLWMQRRLGDAAAEWEREKEDGGFLLSGSRLELFRAWGETSTLRLSGEEQRFLEASLDEQRRREEEDIARTRRERALERRATRWLRALVAVFAASTVVATALLLVVLAQGEAARQGEAIARAGELSAASVAKLSTDPRLSLLLGVEAARATADRGFITEQAMEALDWALQTSHVAFPASPGAAATRPGPGGVRGIWLLAPESLVQLAAGHAGRSLTDEECRTYLGVGACPAGPPASLPSGLEVMTGAGRMPVDRLPLGSLAETRVEIASELPADLAPLTSTLADASGPKVVWSKVGGAALGALGPGELPDIAIVSRPSEMVELARAGRLLELGGIVDERQIRSELGDGLFRVGVVGAHRRWPADDGDLYGVPIAMTVESLVWYPEAAFRAAGYSAPTTWDGLLNLGRRIVADGRTPWCLGGVGTEAGTSGADWVEELVLQTMGPAAYDAWAFGGSSFLDIRTAFTGFAQVAFDDGSLYNPSGFMATPARMAGLPMLSEPPGCWLYQSDGVALSSWPTGRSTVAAFRFPGLGAGSSDPVRGHAYELVVFHDRPEVREIVRSLLGQLFGQAITGTLGSDGLFSPRSLDVSAGVDGATRLQADMLRRALGSGSFRVDASDLMPAAVSTAFSDGMVAYLSWKGQEAVLDQVLHDIQIAWPTSGG